MSTELPERVVDPDQLADLIKKSDSLVVTQQPIANSPQLYESKDKYDIVALLDALSIAKPKEWFHCMCIGSPAISLYRGNEILVKVTNHHANSVRCSLWDSDALITDTDRWLKWFDERGVGGPREEYEESIAMAQQSEIDYKRWKDAMPSYLRDSWDAFVPDLSMGIVRIDPLVYEMSKQTTCRREVITDLFAWFGSGAGPWSGFPCYESAAEELLFQFETSELIDAVQPEHMTSQQLEGAARLFAGWSFRKKRKKHLQLLPCTVKEALWQAVQHTSDAGNRARANKAFRE